MMTTDARKIEKETLPEVPAWLKEMQKDVKKSRLGKMSEEEIGQLCEDLAERGAKKRRTQKDLK